MTWYENHEVRKARFVPVESPPETVWPGRGFHNDVYGGYGSVNVTGNRYDVLSKNSPPWAAAILDAAASAAMPLRAQKIGRAGKYNFWRLSAATPAEAERESRELKAEAERREYEREVADMRLYWSLRPNQAIVTKEGEVILAEAVQSWKNGFSRPGRSCGHHRMLVDGKILPIPAGATLQTL